jgi:L-ascorbate metabolism protein UlaG (beta-lactamase superfamily)
MLKNLIWLMSFSLFSCHSAKSTPTEDTFTTTSGKQVKIECYRHASLCIVYDGHAIQIDPVTDKEHGIRFDNKGKADAILITHDHYDHLDKVAIEQLSKQGTEIILNGDSYKQLGKGIVLKNGESHDLSFGVKVEAVAAYNTTPDHLKFHPKGRDNGYILNIENLRIYIAADTEVIPEMKDIKDIDIAFMPCNQPYTMTPAQLVEAAKIVRPRILFPYHFSDTDLSDIPEKMKALGIETRIRDMQ